MNSGAILRTMGVAALLATICFGGQAPAAAQINQRNQPMACSVAGARGQTIMYLSTRSEGESVPAGATIRWQATDGPPGRPATASGTTTLTRAVGFFIDQYPVGPANGYGSCTASASWTVVGRGPVIGPVVRRPGPVVTPVDPGPRRDRSGGR